MMTKYQGEASDVHGKNYGWVEGHPRSAQAEDNYLSKWKGEIERQVNEQMNIEHSIEPTPSNSKCHLYVNFYLYERRKEHLDIDNLLKPFLKQIKEIGLINGHIRGIKAQKEKITEEERCAKTKKQGVEFWYLVTKSFYIVKVDDIEEKIKEYSPEWNNKMKKIQAEECINGERGPLCTFIDNMPGNVFIGSETDKKRDIIPGYHWKKWENKNKCVDGCLVFHKKPSVSPKGRENEKYWWINKW